MVQTTLFYAIALLVSGVQGLWLREQSENKDQEVQPIAYTVREDPGIGKLVTFTILFPNDWSQDEFTLAYEDDVDLKPAIVKDFLNFGYYYKAELDTYYLKSRLSQNDIRPLAQVVGLCNSTLCYENCRYFAATDKSLCLDFGEDVKSISVLNNPKHHTRTIVFHEKEQCEGKDLDFTISEPETCVPVVQSLLARSFHVAK